MARMVRLPQSQRKVRVYTCTHMLTQLTCVIHTSSSKKFNGESLTCSRYMYNIPPILGFFYHYMYNSKNFNGESHTT